jgi:D-alanyl-D-alanine carboxypeptidase/D-alanyl-D-alanine endopeptidase (penicillin-binding protein 7)
MLKKSLFALLFSVAVSAGAALPFSSQHALVYEEETGQILAEKDAHAVVPIASLTKLMTAMVVLDAKLDMNEMISIEESDVDTLKHSSSRVPVGVSLSRKTVLQLALMSSDNRAAAALARTFPGGNVAFNAAVKSKLEALGMKDTTIEEPTGLSPHNRSTAADLVKMATAAAGYSEISNITTETGETFDMRGRAVQYRNTNSLVGKSGWDILLSKTGFTSEAGRCLIMRIQTAGKHVIVVLLNAREGAHRLMDAENVRRYLSGQPLFSAHAPVRKARSARSPVTLVKAKAVTNSQARKKRRGN